MEDEDLQFMIAAELVENEAINLGDENDEIWGVEEP